MHSVIMDANSNNPAMSKCNYKSQLDDARVRGGHNELLCTGDMRLIKTHKRRNPFQTAQKDQLEVQAFLTSN